MQSEGVDKPERYASGGVVGGVLGLAGVLTVATYGVVGATADYAPWFWAALVLTAFLIYLVLMRPAVVLHGSEVELRNLVSSWWVPYARLTGVEVKQMTKLYVSGERYVGAGFGRTRRAIRRDGAIGASPGEQAREVDDKASLGRLVEAKLERRMSNARRDRAEAGPVRRTWAWPELGTLGALVVVVLLLALAG